MSQDEPPGKDIGRVNLHTARRRDPEAEGITEKARRVGEQHMQSLLSDPVRQRFADRVRGGHGG